jgi:hypothetical protein
MGCRVNQGWDGFEDSEEVEPDPLVGPVCEPSAEFQRIGPRFKSEPGTPVGQCHTGVGAMRSVKLERAHAKLLSPPTNSIPSVLAVTLIHRRSGSGTEDPFGNLTPTVLDLLAVAIGQKVEQCFRQWRRHEFWGVRKTPLKISIFRRRRESTNGRN